MEQSSYTRSYLPVYNQYNKIDMKQAEEILNRIGHTQDGTKFSFSYNEALEAMKEYAKLVAEQALENASESAKLEDSIALGENNIIRVKVVDKSSITNPDNIPTI